MPFDVGAHDETAQCTDEKKKGSLNTKISQTKVGMFGTTGTLKKKKLLLNI